MGDNSDKFPMNPDEWKDSDLDGVGDNSDYRPYDGEVQTREDLESFPFLRVIVAVLVCLGALFVLQTRLGKNNKRRQRKRREVTYSDDYDYEEEEYEDYHYEEE